MHPMRSFCTSPLLCSSLLWIALLGAALVAQPLAAQEGDTAATGASILVVKSTESRLVREVSQWIGGPRRMPQLESGHHYVLTLDAERKVAIETSVGDIAFFELEADPGALMRVYDDEIQQVRQMAQGVATMALAQQGIDMKTARETVDSILAFPHQLEAFSVTVSAGIVDFANKPVAFEFALTAQPGSFAAQLVTALRPSAKGVPILAHTETSMLDLAVSLDPKLLPALMTPFLDFGLSFSYPKEAARANALEVWNAMVSEYDGSIVFALDKDMGIAGLYGFQSADKLRQIVGSDDYLEMMRTQQAGRDIEIEVTPEALRYAGNEFLKMTIYNDGPPNPMMPDGKMESYSGPVGNYLVMAHSEAATKELADLVGKQAPERRSLPGGAVMTMKCSLRKFLAAAGSMAPGGIRIAERVPETLAIDVRADGRTVAIGLQTR